MQAQPELSAFTWVFLLVTLAMLLPAALSVATGVFAARRGGWAVGAAVASTVVVAVLLLGFLGIAGTRTVVVPRPAVVAYEAQPLAALPPAYQLEPAGIPVGQELGAISGPDAAPAAVDAADPGSAPAEALRPTEPTAAASSQALPEWVSEGTTREGDREFVVVSGLQYADAAAAERDAVSKAAELVRRDFERASRPSGRWVLAPEQARSTAVRNAFTEEIRRTAGENEFTVYRTHLRVELSPAVREAVEPIWRRQVSAARSATAGGAFALLTAVAAVLAGYFRLDDRTQGRYRWRLRFGSAAALALATGVVTVAVKALPAAHPEPPGEATIEARTAGQEGSVGGRDEERFRQVAGHMVEAINAADYEGVRRDFNETMRFAFPVEKCRAFFGREISGRFGTIHELGPPEMESASAAVLAARCDRGILEVRLVLDGRGQVAGMLFRSGDTTRGPWPVPGCAGRRPGAPFCRG